MMSFTEYNLTPNAKKAIKDAKLFAASNSHDWIRSPHLMYGCVSNLSDRVELLFQSRGIDYTSKEFIKDFKPFASKNKEYFKRSKNSNAWHKELNDIVADAKSFSDENEDYFVGVEHILYCILKTDAKCKFLEYVNSRGLDIKYISDVLFEIIIDSNLTAPKEKANFEFPSTEDILERIGSYPKTKYLSEFCVDLNQKAMEVSQTPITSRDAEIAEVIEIISKKNKSNAILIGEAGVGKSAIVEGLAQKIVKGEVPAHISYCTLYSVDIASMLAGTMYRGQFEERFKGLVKEVEDRDDIILFFDEIHTLMGAGSSNDTSIDASNMLKPALARGAIKCIGATTFKEYKKSFDKDPAIKRRFDKVEITEPTKAQTAEMINSCISFYEDFHRVKYSKRNIQDILDLSEIYLSNKRFPDKAFDVIDQVGAKAKIQDDYDEDELQSIRERFNIGGVEEESEIETEALIKDYVKDLVSYIGKKDRSRKISRDQILEVFEKKTGIPKKVIGESNKSFSLFKNKMKKEIFGQDEAMDRIYNILSSVKVGLNDPNKPLANFLFVGPTSVGKTFTAKNIAKYFFGNQNSFLQINMSEYQDKTGVSKLLGANAGYIGHEEGGILTEFVSENPNSVILFDEIEKSDPKILDLLLHLLDEGYVSDNFNRKIDLSKCIIILTTNIGHQEAAKSSVGFINDNNEEVSYKESLAKYLRPELIARIENTLIFNALNDKIMESIVSREIDKVRERLQAKEVSLSVPKSVNRFIVQEVKNKKLNARNIKSLVIQLVQFPLASFMINNQNSKKISLKIVDKEVKVY